MRKTALKLGSPRRRETGPSQVVRELKHRRRNGRTATAGSEILASECSAQARTSLNVVQGSSTTKFLWVWRSRENVSAKQ